MAATKFPSVSDVNLKVLYKAIDVPDTRGAQSTELVWILDFKQILILLLFIIT